MRVILTSPSGTELRGDEDPVKVRLGDIDGLLAAQIDAQSRAAEANETLLEGET